MRFVLQCIKPQFNILNDLSDYLSASWRYRSWMSSYSYMDILKEGLNHPGFAVKNVSIAYDFQNQNPQPTNSVLFEGNSRPVIWHKEGSIIEEAKQKQNTVIGSHFTVQWRLVITDCSLVLLLYSNILQSILPKRNRAHTHSIIFHHFIISSSSIYYHFHRCESQVMKCILKNLPLLSSEICVYIFRNKKLFENLTNDSD